MQLHVARLCLDCQEVHADSRCPVCTSESFAALSRWIPPQERRLRTRAAGQELVENYRRLLDETPAPAKTRSKWPTRTALVIATLGVGGWLWRRSPGGSRASGDRDREEESAS